MIEPCLAPCTYGPGKPDSLRRLRPARTPAFEPEFRLVDAALPSDRLDRVAPLIRGRIAGTNRIDTTLGTDGKPIPTSRRRRRVSGGCRRRHAACCASLPATHGNRVGSLIFRASPSNFSAGAKQVEIADRWFGVGGRLRGQFEGDSAPLLPAPDCLTGTVGGYGLVVQHVRPINRLSHARSKNVPRFQVKLLAERLGCALGMVGGEFKSQITLSTICLRTTSPRWRSTQRAWNSALVLVPSVPILYLPDLRLSKPKHPTILDIYTNSSRRLRLR